MSASDIPEIGYPTSLAMAKALVTYMACPKAVRSAIRQNFDRSPDLSTIRDLRARHLDKRRPDEAPHRLEAGYYPAKLSEAVRPANARFLAALAMERRA